MITLVTGSNGQLGKTIQSIVKNKSEFIFTDINSLDITKKEKIESVITSHDINCIVNCAAYTDVDGAEIEKEKADDLNDNAIKNLVEISETYKLRLIHISTDYVYDGINKSGHMHKDFLDSVKRNGWAIIHKNDMTLNALPTLKFAITFIDRFIKPLALFTNEKLKYKQGWLFYLTQELRDGLSKKSTKELAALDPKKFIEEKKYMLYVLERKKSKGNKNDN